MRRAHPLAEPSPPRIAARAGALAGGVVLEVAGESVVLCGDRALWWRGVLAVADVHLGKGDAFRARGLPLPPGELDEDLARLSALVEATGAHTLRVLGDLVHGPLRPTTVAHVAAWRATVPAAVELVAGNHDRHAPELPPEWRVSCVGPELADGPFRFVHEPREAHGAFVWAGHLHPTAAFRGRADRLRFPCFVVGPGLGVLPAFTRFSGGPVVRAALGVARYACVEGAVLGLDDERGSP